MYVTDNDYTTYAAASGVTLPATSALRLQQLTKASRYIDTKENQFMGIRTERDQDYAFPRTGYFYHQYEYDVDEIPADLEKCQMELALDVNAGIDLYDRSFSAQVTQKTVEGAVSVSYASPAATSPIRKQSVGMDLLNGLCNKNGSSILLVRT